VKPYRYKEAGLAQVARAFAPREQRPRRWPAIALFAVFLWIFCRADSIRGFASAAPNPAARSNEMNLRMAGAVSALMVAGATSAQSAVQWRVEDGGNGHWYLLQPKVGDWLACRSASLSQGGDLVSPSSAAENAFVEALVPPKQFPIAWNRVFVGARQTPGTAPSEGWYWVDGSAWSFTDWYFNQPNGGEGFLTMMPDSTGCTWGDYPVDSADIVYFIIEWSADCNSDGIVDFGQIRAGELVDANANNIPDCCENGTVCGCPADIVQDGAVNGVDLAAVINAWGTNGGMLPRTDIDRNGIVDGGDLAQVLGAWGICP